MAPRFRSSKWRSAGRHRGAQLLARAPPGEAVVLLGVPMAVVRSAAAPRHPGVGPLPAPAVVLPLLAGAAHLLLGAHPVAPPAAPRPEAAARLPPAVLIPVLLRHLAGGNDPPLPLLALSRRARHSPLEGVVLDRLEFLRS